MRKVCGIVWCIVGSDEEAEKAMAPMLAVGKPLMHGAGRAPLPGLNSAFDALYAPGDQWYWRADFVNEIPDEAMALERGVERRKCRRGSRARTSTRSTAPHTTSVADETPWAYRDTRWSQVIIGVDPEPSTRPRCATGRSATGRRSIRSPRAARTSTS